MSQPRVYLSGALQSNWRNRVIKELGSGFEFFNPVEHGFDVPNHYTVWDLHFIRECDILFGYMEQDNPSGYGLVLELGYARGLGKTVVLVDERSTVDPKFKTYFAIAHSVADVAFDTLEDGLSFLRSFLRGRVTQQDIQE